MKLNRTTTAIAALFLWTTVHANTITVTSTADNGAGTLRNALASVANGDTINFTVTGSITLTTGQLVISNSVAIFGPGPGSLAVNGNAASRVLYITNAVTAVISGLAITNGAVSGAFPGFVGAGIWNDHSTLTLSNCVISGNYGGGGSGGGIYNDASFGSATLSIIASTLSGNSVSNSGGAIQNFGYDGSATLSIIASTLSGNTAAGNGTVGGAIFNNGNFGGATLLVSNSTFSGNSADQQGGAIYNAGAAGVFPTILTVRASTFSGNSAPGNGGAIFINGAASFVSLGDTILKTGTSGSNIVNNGGFVTSAGYNLSSDNANGLLTSATDQLNIDPMLGPLANNGGPTFTCALLTGSPAIDKGNSFGLATDQRGLPRSVDAPCIPNAAGGDGSDIGAFEAQGGCPSFQITAITRETNNIRITWSTSASKTNVLESTAGTAGNYSNNFAAIFTVTNTVGTITNYLDIGAATNFPARYYRVRLVP